MTFERFTKPAREAVRAAQEQARALDHRFIATPHLLLGLVEGEGGDLLRAHGVTAGAVRETLAGLVGHEPGAMADDAAVLAALGIDIARIRAAAEASFGPGALELSLREALRLGNNHIGAEHLTLGLLRCGDGAAAVVLDRLGVDVGAIRRDAGQRLRRPA